MFKKKATPKTFQDMLERYQAFVKLGQPIVDVGYNYVVAINDARKGRVTAFGDNRHRECEVGRWKNVVYVFAKDGACGVTRDGRGLGTVGDGWRKQGTAAQLAKRRCVQLVLGDGDAFVKAPEGYSSLNDRLNDPRGLLPFDPALKITGARDGFVVFDDGHVELYPPDYFDESAQEEMKKVISKWTDVVQVAFNYYDELHPCFFVGLRADGSLLYEHNGKSTELDRFANWDNVAVLGADLAWALKKDGTMLYDPSACEGRPPFADWTDIVQAVAVANGVAGLRADGTVALFLPEHDSIYQTGEEPSESAYRSLMTACEWKNIIGLHACGSNLLGVKDDGSVVMCGDDTYGQCGISGLHVLDDIDAAIAAAEKRVADAYVPSTFEMKQAARMAERRCKYCGGHFKGLLSKRCVVCSRKKDY